ncbi:hypothetical protein C8R44DRAFT_942551 [Mycena epipterygia]|nr:hypothetical protein C8R44DRAFT_942551 [Mycena epipterygia]
MPRSVTDPKPPRRSPKSGKKAPFPPLQHRCAEPGCPWSYTRKYDRLRHELTHMSPAEREEHMISCDYPGCKHKTLQRSNMDTHLRTHTGEKSQTCPECTYCTGDPALLTQHKKKMHGYTPRGRRDISYTHQTLSPSPSSSSFGSAPSPPSYSAVYLTPDTTPSPEADYASSAGSSWSSDAEFAAACGIDIPAVDTYGVVTSTARPGPAALYPSADVDIFQSFPDAQSSYDQIAELLAKTAGLDSPPYLSPSPSPDIDWSCLLELSAPSTQFDFATAGMELFLDPVQYHADGSTVFDTEWLGVV